MIKTCLRCNGLGKIRVMHKIDPVHIVACPECKGLGRIRDGEPITSFPKELTHALIKMGKKGRIVLDTVAGIAIMTVTENEKMSDDKMLECLSDTSRIGHILEQKYNWLVRY